MLYICNIRGGVLRNKEAFCEVLNSKFAKFKQRTEANDAHLLFCICTMRLSYHHISKWT